ncbi:MAG: hypothetical protein K8R85_15625 [Bacteroidetes bacterium]|nr:hypothetical protein [Bacteroidota bacterium]
MPATIINSFGKIIGWNNVTYNAYNRDIEGIAEIEYSDEVKSENEYGAGGFPMGQSSGNYEAKGSVTLYSEEIVGLQSSLPPGVRIQDIPPAPINVVYELNGSVVRDVLNNCRIKNVGKAVKQGDGKITHKCDLLISHIDWNV